MTHENKASHFKHNKIQNNFDKLYKAGESKVLVCVYSILCKENCIPTTKLVELALSKEYVNECITCSSADSVYRALKKLQEKGWIIGHLKKDGYIWELLLDDA
ncbi:MAG: hypothetical protein HZR80_09145 [Candidatus Heimdallarchaeota archaeon]